MTGAAVEAKPQKIVAGLEPEVRIMIVRQRMNSFKRCTNAPLVENLQIHMSIKFWERQIPSLKRRRRRKKSNQIGLPLRHASKNLPNSNSNLHPLARKKKRRKWHPLRLHLSKKNLSNRSKRHSKHKKGNTLKISSESKQKQTTKWLSRNRQRKRKRRRTRSVWVSWAARRRKTPLKRSSVQGVT